MLQRFAHPAGPAIRTHPGRRRARGFTLIEVMVVIVILGVLAALVVPRIMSRPDEARVVAARQDIASLMQALKLYKLDNRRYPSTEQGLGALVASVDHGGVVLPHAPARHGDARAEPHSGIEKSLWLASRRRADWINRMEDITVRRQQGQFISFAGKSRCAQTRGAKRRR